MEQSQSFGKNFSNNTGQNNEFQNEDNVDSSNLIIDEEFDLQFLAYDIQGQLKRDQIYNFVIKIGR